MQTSLGEWMSSEGGGKSMCLFLNIVLYYVIYTVHTILQPNVSEPPDTSAQPNMTSQPSSPEPENRHGTAAAALIELFNSAPQAATNAKPGTPSTGEHQLADSPSSMSESSVLKASNSGDEEGHKQTDVSYRDATVDRNARLVSPHQVLAAAQAAAAAQQPTSLPSRPSRSLWPTPTADKTVGRLDSSEVSDAPDAATGHGLRGSSSTEKPPSSDAFPKPPGPEPGMHISSPLDITFADIFRSSRVLSELSVGGHKFSVGGRECCCSAPQSNIQSVRPRHSTCTRSLQSFFRKPPEDG